MDEIEQIKEEISTPLSEVVEPNPKPGKDGRGYKRQDMRMDAARQIMELLETDTLGMGDRIKLLATLEKLTSIKATRPKRAKAKTGLFSE